MSTGNLLVHIPGGKETEKRSPESEVLGVDYWTQDGISYQEIVTTTRRGGFVDGSYAIVEIGDAIRLLTDPLGTIPLYFSWTKRGVVVGISACEVARETGSPLDGEMARIYSILDYIPQPWTAFRGVMRCDPGSVTVLNPRTREAKTTRYFDLEKQLDGERPRTVSEIPDLWEASVAKVVRGCSVTQGPLGLSLSGGLDSRFALSCGKRLGLDISAYTYATSNRASDRLIAEQLAQMQGIRWRFIPVEFGHLEKPDVLRFVSDYFSLEPLSMAFLPNVVSDLRTEESIERTIVASGGDTIWGSHSNLKQFARAEKDSLSWRRYCQTRNGAWAAASEVGDCSWAHSAKDWDRAFGVLGQLFDSTVVHGVSRTLADRIWSVSYRQPSYTWNSCLVYHNQGIKVLSPTLTIESVLAGLSLPKHVAWSGTGYERALLRYDPAACALPLTRTRTKPNGNLLRLTLADLQVAFGKWLGRDTYCPWMSRSDWEPLFEKVGIQAPNSIEAPKLVELRFHLARQVGGSLAG